VREQPFSVVLFDEIEKCHPRVLHLLLQVTGDGRLTDAAGDVADFTHAVVVLTSNLGSAGTSRVGFEESSPEAAAGAREREVAAAVEAHLPPELWNRIDRVVAFRPITRPVARTIARRELQRLLGRRGLVERGIFVRATERVLDRVTAEGFRADEGARSLKRYLERHVGGPLAELIAGSAGAEMRRVVVHAGKEGFALYSEELREARPTGSEPTLAPFLRRSADQLRGELAGALGLVEDMAESPELAGLSERLRLHLAEYRIGRTGLADRIYNIDALRDRLGDLGERLERQIAAAEPDLGEQIELERFAFLDHRDSWDSYGRRRVRLLDRRAFGDVALAGKAELLALLAGVHFLRRAVARVEDVRRHAVFVELSQVGQAAAAELLTHEPRREGLLEWLAACYGAARGELEGFAAAASFEEVVEEGEDLRSLDAVLARLPSRVVLKLAGLSVLDRFAGEHGCHVLSRLGGVAEIVRVAVRPAPPEVTAAGKLAAGEAARRRFVDALEGEVAAGELPPNPDELLPVVRRYRYDPPDDGAPSLCEVEDYVLCHAAGHRVRSFAEVLAVLSLLHQTVETGGTPA
jgi:ATP-dependent Clp protease ATP-binding subunit ClpA/ATP-dependent Clp protease ATP-binding subunit ClpC